VPKHSYWLDLWLFILFDLVLFIFVYLLPWLVCQYLKNPSLQVWSEFWKLPLTSWIKKIGLCGSRISNLYDLPLHNTPSVNSFGKLLNEYWLPSFIPKLLKLDILVYG
jgi:hypothetical protein